MSKKRFLNLTVALLQDIYRMPCNNKNLDGKTLKWLTIITDIPSIHTRLTA